jgi:hypothetical protein
MVLCLQEFPKGLGICQPLPQLDKLFVRVKDQGKDSREVSRVADICDEHRNAKTDNMVE